MKAQRPHTPPTALLTNSLPTFRARVSQIGRSKIPKDPKGGDSERNSFCCTHGYKRAPIGRGEPNGRKQPPRYVNHVGHEF